MSLRFFLLFLFASSYCAFGFAQTELGNDHVLGQLIVQFTRHANPEELCTTFSKESGVEFKVEKELSSRLNIWLISFESGLNDEDARVLVEREAGVQLAQYNHVNIVDRGQPNDSLFNKQWAFENDGSNGGSGLFDISALAAWDIATGGLSPIGDTIVVAVIDQGFDMSHIDLLDNYFINRNEIVGNGFDDDGNGYVDDVSGWNCYTNSPIHPNNNHGTHVAGTVGAKGNNEIGVTGVNWNVKVLPITGSSTLESIVVEAYAYVLEMRTLYNETNGEKGAYIVSTNASFGVDNGQPIDFPIWCSLYDSLGYQGVLSAGATANNNVDIDQVGDIPTSCDSPFLISVTNTTSSDQINSSAAYGLETIDLGAPGTKIYSTVPGDNYGNNTGTSMATPHVAGAIGLMYNALCEDVFNAYKYDQAGLALFLKEKLLTEGVDEISNLNGKVVSGGRLNLYKSVESVSSICTQIIFNGSNSDCDSCNGSIEATLVGSVGPYQYFWFNGMNSDSIFGLCAGVYTLTVVDGNGDSITSTFPLSDNGGPSLDVQIHDPSCFETSDGMVTIHGGYNYGWSDGSFGANRTALLSGDYFVTATDSAGVCTTAVKINLVAPDSLSLYFEYQESSSELASDGSILAIGSGGAPPYSFVWDTGDTSVSLSGIPNGMYSVTLTDNNGCMHVDSIQLGFPLGLERLKNEELHNIRIWPNPASNSVQIECDFESADVFIFNSNGILVKKDALLSARHMIVSTENLANGFYTISICAGKSTQHFKLIIAHEP